MSTQRYPDTTARELFEVTMSPLPIWPQPPSSAVTPAPRPAVPSAPLTHRVTPAAPPAPKQSYLEQLRQTSTPQAASYVELLRAATPSPDAPPLSATDTPLREALIQLLAHTLATGREMISGRELFWRLQIPPQ